MARPSLPARSVHADAIQTAARVRFELSHDPLRRRLRYDHCVHVSRTDMGRQQTPAPMRTYLLNCLQNGIATYLIQTIGTLIHAFPLGCEPCWIHLEDGGSENIMRAIHRTGFATVQMASIAGKGDQVGHRW